MKVPSKYVDKFDKFQSRVTSLPSGKYAHAGVYKPSHLVPKSTLTKYNPKINLGKTVSNLMGNLDYPGKTIKAGWDIMGEGYTTGDKLSQLGKNISSEGLAFLKNKAFRTLAMLGSLPAQAGIMSLSPTMMGNAELPQMPQGSPTQISGGNGGGNGGYQGGGGKPGSMPTGTAGRNPWRRADGGLINLYRYGGFI